MNNKISIACIALIIISVYFIANKLQKSPKNQQDTPISICIKQPAHVDQVEKTTKTQNKNTNQKLSSKDNTQPANPVTSNNNSNYVETIEPITNESKTQDDTTESNDDVENNNNSLYIKGEKSIDIEVTDSNNNSSKKTVKILDININNKQKEQLQKIADKLKKKNDLSYFNFQSTQDLEDINYSAKRDVSNFDVDLGMSNVPVLDQGQHGTCLTFRDTAMLDAKMNAGDYISQQCLLELGVHLNKTKGKNIDSGWNGAIDNEFALNRIKTYGIIDKETCPHTYANDKYSMTEGMYISYSNKLWSKDFSTKNLYEGDLQQLKRALNNGNRVALATILHIDNAAGSPINSKNNGLWELPKDIDKFVHELIFEKKAGGHAIIATGYDDEKQLIKIRNSWSKYAGDEGEFYMTYDYYELMVMMATEVR